MHLATSPNTPSSIIPLHHPGSRPYCFVAVATRIPIVRSKMPRISGGTRVEMFNNEFRARLSLIMSPSPSSIHFSKAYIELMLVLGPILCLLCVSAAKGHRMCSLTSTPTLTHNFRRLMVRPCKCLEEAISRGGNATSMAFGMGFLGWCGRNNITRCWRPRPLVSRRAGITENFLTADLRQPLSHHADLQVDGGLDNFVVQVVSHM